MDSVRRASSAGYRLPERNNGPTASQPPAAATRRAPGEAPSQEPDQDKNDPVKKDHLWKELVWTEKRGAREWEKNWDFLLHYDQMGQLKPQEPLPSSVTRFSDHIPNTTNRMFGSRLTTPLGRELVKLDRLRLPSANHQKRKLDPEMLPC